MADNLKAAAFAAGLSDAERREVEALNKTLSIHRELSNLPEAIAAQSYNSKTPLQQEALKKAAGEQAAEEQEGQGEAEADQAGRLRPKALGETDHRQILQAGGSPDYQVQHSLQEQHLPRGECKGEAHGDEGE